MPQINFYTYLSQTTWTIILFFFFYFFMKQYFLPLLYENIKLKTLILKYSKTKNQNLLKPLNLKNSYNYNKIIKL